MSLKNLDYEIVASRLPPLNANASGRATGELPVPTRIELSVDHTNVGFTVSAFRAAITQVDDAAECGTDAEAPAQDYAQGQALARNALTDCEPPLPEYDVEFPPPSQPLSRRLGQLKRQIVQDAIAPIKTHFYEHAGAIKLELARLQTKQKRQRARSRTRRSLALSAICFMTMWTGVTFAKQYRQDAIVEAAQARLEAPSLTLEGASAAQDTWQERLNAAHAEVQRLRDAVREARTEMAEGAKSASSSDSKIRLQTSTRKTPRAQGKPNTASRARSVVTKKQPVARTKRCDPNDPMTFDPLNDCLP